jgi:hypothetical protein
VSSVKHTTNSGEEHVKSMCEMLVPEGLLGHHPIMKSESMQSWLKSFAVCKP